MRGLVKKTIENLLELTLDILYVLLFVRKSCCSKFAAF